MGFFDKMFGSKDGGTKISQQESADFVTALQMHLRGELESAIAAYDRFAADSPNDNLAPFFAAAARAALGDVTGAAERLRSLSRRAAEEETTISRAVAGDLVALLHEEPFLKVPDVAEVVISLGDTLKSHGLVQESAVCFEVAAGLLPDHANVLYKLGDTLHDLRMYEYADKVLQEALRLAPNHWDSLYTHAVLLQDLGRFDEALEQYENAVRLNPDHVKCRNNYGAALMIANRLDEALVQCGEAERLDPSFPLAQVNLGNINLLKGDAEAARACFERAISLEGTLALAHFGLGSAEQSLGADGERVRQLYLRAIELNPSFAEFHHALGKLLAREGDPAAVTYLAAAVQLNGSLRYVYRDLGLACLQMGRREEGMEHLKVALLQNPDDAEIRNLLAEHSATG